MRSIVDWFSLLPWLASVVGIAAPIDCPLVLAAARALPAAIREDGQNDSRLATTPDEPAGVETAALWPRCGGLAPLCRDGRSDSPCTGYFVHPF